MRQIVKIVRKYTLYFVLLVGFVSLMIVFINKDGNYSAKTPASQKGVMNLTNWSFEKNGSVMLNGEWEFYYEKLLDYGDFHSNSKSATMSGYIKVPGRWRNYKINGKNINTSSYGTYRLKVQLNKKIANDALGIHIPYQFTAYKLMINDKQIASKADNLDKNATIIENRNIFFNPEDSNMEIIIQIPSQVFGDGGTHLPLYLGRYEDIITKDKNNLLREMMLFTCLMIMGLYHVLLFIFLKKMKYILNFGLLCIGIALRSIYTNEAMLIGQFLTVNFSTYSFFNLPVTLLCMIFFAGFIYELYPQEFSNMIYKAILLFFGVMITTSIILPYSLNSKLIGFDNIAIVICAIYFSYVIIRASLNKREGYKLMIFAMLIMAVSSISDVIFIYSKSYSVINDMTTLGTIIFVFVIALLLSKKYANAFISVDNLSKKLLSLDKLKDEFLASTSHELRTPLNGIIGIAESLSAGAAGETSDEVKRNLSIMSASGKRLSNLINDILDYSKLKYTDIKLMHKPLDFYQLVDVTMAVFIMTKHNEKIVLKNELPVDLPYFNADEARLQQIMYNLLDNAIKFTEEGEISVSVKLLLDYIEITVKDTGIGIPKDKQEDIFKSFEQIDVSGEGNYGGTGLGLTICKKLIELHGGTIRCKSVLGSGSRFIFTLPMSEYNYEIATSERSADRQLSFDHILTNANTNSVNHKAKILVVDDEPVNIQVLINQLSLENYNVVTATNGQTGLRLINEVDFDLIILDAMMPKMSGYEVCKRIREKHSLIDLPILMLTANNQLSNICLAYDCGINDYVRKPFEKQELIARIKTLVTMKKAVKQSIRDPLTGIYNRKHMFELGEIIFDNHKKEGKHMSAIMIDIDNFKAVNDTYGHAQGDNILNEVAAECKNIIRVNDIFGRYGGEEFFIILPNIEIEDTVKLADRIREKICIRPLSRHEGKEIYITISLGVATNNKTISSIEQLVREADKAMYKAKENGKNRVET
ncbi:MAG: two-component system sensor histidine kinase ChiS [Clostridium sp.]|jgi:two-component system sensor histidine kinase ChiS